MYKVWDKIRILKNNNYHYHKIWAEVYITHIGSCTPRYRTSKTKGWKYISWWYVDDSEIELVEEWFEDWKTITELWLDITREFKVIYTSSYWFIKSWDIVKLHKDDNTHVPEFKRLSDWKEIYISLHRLTYAEPVEETKLKVWDCVKYRTAQRQYTIISIAWYITCSIKDNITGNIYSTTIDKLELVEKKLEEVNPVFKLWDKVKLNKKSEYYKSFGQLNDNIWIITEIDLDRKNPYKVEWDNWTDYNKYKAKDLLIYTETNYIGDDLPQWVNITESFEGNILNTNYKTMSNITNDANQIETTVFFDDAKNLKAIRKVNTEMEEQLSILGKAQKDIDSKRAKLNILRVTLDTQYSEKNLKWIKLTMSKYESVKEFIDTYIKNTVKLLWTTEVVKEEFDVVEFFKD